MNSIVRGFWVAFLSTVAAFTLEAWAILLIIFSARTVFIAGEVLWMINLLLVIIVHTLILVQEYCRE
jgi:hypothetical protein